MTCKVDYQCFHNAEACGVHSIIATLGKGFIGPLVEVDGLNTT